MCLSSTSFIEAPDRRRPHPVAHARDPARREDLVRSNTGQMSGYPIRAPLASGSVTIGRILAGDRLGGIGEVIVLL